jgi:K+-transporting ATPase KdpF subunit
MNSILLATGMETAELITNASYILGAVIAVIILGYLIYSLFKPEKF